MTTRYECKKGYIEKWVGDAASHPNKPSAFKVNSTATYWRLNGTGEWVYHSDISRIYLVILKLKDSMSAQEIWEWAQ